MGFWHQINELDHCLSEGRVESAAGGLEERLMTRLAGFALQWAKASLAFLGSASATSFAAIFLAALQWLWLDQRSREH